MPFLDVEGNPIPEDQSVYGSVRVLASRRTVLVRSQTTVEDVMEITAVTTRHGVDFIRYVPYANWLQANSLVLVAPIGYQIDQALDLSGVLAAQFVQSTDDYGLLTNGIEFTVSIPDQTDAVTSTVVIPLQVFYDGDNWIQMIADAQNLIGANVGGYLA